MVIISHRGFWNTENEKNTEVAFKRSFENNYGTETDIRDAAGQLVISHDVPTGGEISAGSFLDMAAVGSFPLALNIKADGLAVMLRELMNEKKNSNWFVFDMSVPDMRHHLLTGNPVFTRVSEIERDPVFYKESAGIWLDAFFSIWYTPEDIRKWLMDGKRVCIVSPELHKRDHIELWNMLKKANLQAEPDMILCTDIPDQAKTFFEI